MLDTADKEAALPLLLKLQLLDMADAIETVEQWAGEHLDFATALCAREGAESLLMGELKAQADDYIDTHFEVVRRWGRC